MIASSSSSCASALISDRSRSSRRGHIYTQGAAIHLSVGLVLCLESKVVDTYSRSQKFLRLHSYLQPFSGGRVRSSSFCLTELCIVFSRGGWQCWRLAKACGNLCTILCAVPLLTTEHTVPLSLSLSLSLVQTGSVRGIRASADVGLRSCRSPRCLGDLEAQDLARRSGQPHL
eukprot:4444662-Pleurochrysis_carterae.AAC.3